jgi:hypothetical protein
VLTSWGSTVWGIIVSWDWQTFGPIVTALAVGVTALATIVYTIGTLLLWVTTRRSVRAMEDAVKLTFLQMMYETKKPSGRSAILGRAEDLIRYGAERAYKDEYNAALQRAFPKLYARIATAEQKSTPEKRQDGQ